jgi:hypothetical protein
VRVPLTVKLSAEDAVSVFKAQLAVPYKDPVTPPSILNEPVIECILLALSINLLFVIGLIPPTKRFSSLLPDVLPIFKPGASVYKYEYPAFHPG